MDLASRTNIVYTVDYLDGYQYESGKLLFFPTAEGYVKYTVGVSNPFDYVFNYTDHLGNIRLSYGINPATGLLKKMEENNYYPFGLKHGSYNIEEIIIAPRPVGGPVAGKMGKFMLQKEPPVIAGELDLPTQNPTIVPEFYSGYSMKYNGKELQDELGLNVYDYGARMYDPADCTWWGIDPLTEQMRRWSPYNYCFNNPMRFIDPDGMGPNDIIISGSDPFKKQAFNDLQKLSNDKLVLLPNGQVKIDPSSSLSNSTKSLPVGTNLVSDLISSSKVVTVVETTKGNQTVSTTDGSATANGKGPGADSTVEYNLNSKGSGIVNADGTKGRPAEIGLGHELAHAQENKNGTSDDKMNTTAKDPDSGLTGVLSNNEISVRKTDSAIRKEQGVVERKQP